MATEWTTLLDWQPNIAAARFGLYEAPTDLSPALAAAEDDSLLYVEMLVTYDVADAITRQIWTPWPAIRAGDFRNAPVGHSSWYDNTWSIVEEGVTADGSNWFQAFLTKGPNGRPAFVPQSRNLALRRMRIRLLSLPSPAPAPVTPQQQPSATTAPAPTPVPTPAPRDGAIRSLAVTNDPNQRLLTQIGSIIIAIDLRWDDLSGYWYLGAEQNGRPLIAGRRVTPGLRLLPPLTGWQLVAAPLSDKLVSVGRNAWGQTHVLLYVGDGAGVSWLR